MSGNVTVRDMCWHGALEVLFMKDSVTPDEVLMMANIGKESRRTAKRVLNAMEDIGYLEREHDRARRWNRSEQFEELVLTAREWPGK